MTKAIILLSLALVLHSVDNFACDKPDEREMSGKSICSICYLHGANVIWPNSSLWHFVHPACYAEIQAIEANVLTTPRYKRISSEQYRLMCSFTRQYVQKLCAPDTVYTVAKGCPAKLEAFYVAAKNLGTLDVFAFG